MLVVAVLGPESKVEMINNNCKPLIKSPIERAGNSQWGN